MQGNGIDTVLERCRALSDTASSKVSAAVTQALDMEKREIAGKDKGLCTHALYCAIRSLVLIEQGKSYKAIIKWVITQGDGNTGQGDTDTNAAIAGALVGAYYGFTALMASNRNRKNWKILIKAAKGG